MVKETREKLEKALESLVSAKAGGGEGDLTEEQRAALRRARKKVKRLQRRLKVEKTASEKKEKMEANRLKNQEKAKEAEAKRKAAGESAVEAEAKRQAEETTAGRAEEQPAGAGAEEAAAEQS